MKKGCLAFFLFLLVAMVLTFVGPFTWAVFSRHYSIANALEKADYVELEHYQFAPTGEAMEGGGYRMEQKNIGYKRLEPADFNRVRDAFPLRLDVGFPGVIKKCFIPHHRIVIHEKGGETYKVDICFNCEMICASGYSVQGTPYAWIAPLHRLFTEAGALRNKKIGEFPTGDNNAE